MDVAPRLAGEGRTVAVFRAVFAIWSCSGNERVVQPFGVVGVEKAVG